MTSTDCWLEVSNGLALPPLSGPYDFTIGTGPARFAWQAMQ